MANEISFYNLHLMLKTTESKQIHIFATSLVDNK